MVYDLRVGPRSGLLAIGRSTLRVVKLGQPFVQAVFLDLDREDGSRSQFNIQEVS